MSSEGPERTGADGQPQPASDGGAELKERLSRAENLIRQAAALAAQEARRADEIEGNFAAALAALEAQPQEKESGPPGPGEAADGALDLQNELREKERLLEARNAEFEELKSKLEEASALAAEQAKQTMETEEGFGVTIAGLKTELRGKEELLSQKDVALAKMEESLTALEEALVNQIRILEEQLEAVVQKSAVAVPEPEATGKPPRKPSKQG